MTVNHMQIYYDLLNFPQSNFNFIFFETFPLLLSFTVYLAAKNCSWTYFMQWRNLRMTLIIFKLCTIKIVHNSTQQCLKIMNLKSFCMHLVSERTKRYLSETATHSRLTWDQRGKLKSVERRTHQVLIN